MQENPVFIKVLLWIGIVLFLLWFLAFSIAPERTLPALGLSEHHGFIPRLYGIFQLSWAILFFFALKDIEKNMAIINGALITGALVIIFLVVYSIIKSGWYLLLGAALLLVYTVLLFLCKPKPAGS
jgi:inner membrane protein involved in colicin E2 resistance